MIKDGSFRIHSNEYKKRRSTVFDLIDGSNETKQTKGLAYVLSVEPEFLVKLLKYEPVRQCINRSLYNSNIVFNDIINCTNYRVDAEMTSIDKSSKLRRDISIAFYNEARKLLVLIIEAKNISLSSVGDIEYQLNSYFDTTKFPYENEVPICGIALSKYRQIVRKKNIISITWNEILNIIEELIQKNKLGKVAEDYFGFITGVDKGMNYYEKEVLSLPAGKTAEIVNKYFIHAHPNKLSYNYKSSIFIAFRKSNGGRMDRLYQVKEKIILNPHNAMMLNEDLDDDIKYKARIMNYVNERKKGMGFEDEGTYVFYILNKTNYIDLKHEPRPENNNPGGRYYKLSELLSGREIVCVDN